MDVIEFFMFVLFIWYLVLVIFGINITKKLKRQLSKRVD